jgi:hypothetical protein
MTGLQAHDELLHALANAGTNQENYLFAGLDAVRRAGFYLHVGRQHGLGVCITKIVVFEGDDMYSTAMSRPLTAGLEVPGGRAELIEPYRRWRIRVSGTAAPALSGYHCVREAEGVDYAIDVALESDHAPVVTDYAADGRDQSVTSGMHYEQGMRMAGTLTLAGRTATLDGLLIRDHTWGTRALRKVDTVWWAPVAVAGPPARFIRVTDIIRQGHHDSLAVDLDSAGKAMTYRRVEVALDDPDTDGPLCGYIRVGDRPGRIEIRFDGVVRLPMTYLEGWGDRPILSDETFAVASLPDGPPGMAIVEWNRPMPADRVRALSNALGRP